MVQAQAGAKRETREAQTADVFDLYNRAFRNWLDSVNWWSRLATSSIQSFRSTGADVWFRPFMGATEDWSRYYRDWTEMVRMYQLPFEFSNNFYQAMSMGWSLSMRMYDAWMRATDRMARETYEIGRLTANGEEMRSDKLFDAMRESWETIARTAEDVFKDTPFSWIREVDQTTRKALDSFPEEQRMTRDLVQEAINFSTRARNLSVSAVRQSADMFAEMMRTGNVSGDGYHELVDAYSDTLKRSIEILGYPVDVMPNYREVVDSSNRWAKASYEFYLAWLEVNAKWYSGMARSTGELVRTMEEPRRKEGAGEPAEQVIRSWGDVYQRAMDMMVRNSRFQESMPRLMDAYSRWMRESIDFSRVLLRNPYVTRDEMERTRTGAGVAARETQIQAQTEAAKAKAGAAEKRPAGPPKGSAT